MFILSNKKILAVVAMAACMATLANAEGTRAHARRRGLKTDKSSKGSKIVNPDALNFIAVNNPVVNINTNTDTVSNAFSYMKMDRQCPNEAGALSCAAKPLFCKICIVGQANTKDQGTWQTMKDSCLKINGGHCNGCISNELLGYYNCGTGRNMTETGIAAPDAVGEAPSLTTPGITAPADPAAPMNPVGPVTVDIQSGSFIPGPHPNTMGGPPCPWDKPVPGTACTTLGYEWATCLYTGVNNVCSCRHDQELWSCVDPP